MTARYSATTIVLAATLLLCSCRIERRERASVINADSAVRVEIRNTSARYRAALLQSDDAAAANFFTDSARILDPDTTDFTGMREIRRHLRDSFDGSRLVQSEMNAEVIDVVPGGTVWEMGTFREAWSTGEGDSTTVRRGRYTVRWRRGPDAVWQIDRLMVNHVPADSTAGTMAPAGN